MADIALDHLEVFFELLDFVVLLYEVLVELNALEVEFLLVLLSKLFDCF